MLIINNLVYFSPFILFFYILFLVLNILTREQKSSKLSVWFITPILIIAIILVVYHLPINSILQGYTIDSISISVKDLNVEVTDKEKINKILETINNYKFTKSAGRTIINESYASEYLISIYAYEFKKRKSVQLFVHTDSIAKNALPTIEHGAEKNGLRLGEQMYRCNDNNGLSRDVYNLIKEFGIWK